MKEKFIFLIFGTVIVVLISVASAQDQSGFVDIDNSSDVGTKDTTVGSPNAVGESDDLFLSEPKKESNFFAPIDTHSESSSGESHLKDTTDSVSSGFSINSGLSEGPDLNKESRFHQIFKTYNEQPHSVSEWESIVEKQRGKDYNVQVGDTLWGISVTYFNDGFFWPKIWALNNNIANPHEIRKGDVIRFFPGSMEEPPSVQVADIGKTADNLAASGKLPKGLTIPKTNRKIVSPLKNLPRSLQQVTSSRPSVTKEYGKLGLSVEVLKKPPLDMSQQLAGYIDDASPQGVGEIMEGEMGRQTVGKYDTVFVKLTGGETSGKFLVVREVGKIDDPDRKDIEGIIIDVEGEIEVLENVNPEQNLYRARVLECIHPITTGGVLLPGDIPKISVSETGTTSTVAARIVGGVYEDRRKLFTLNSFVFVNRGTDRGLRDGDILPVIANEKVRNYDTKVSLNTVHIGLVKIIKVKNHFSTGIVVKANDAIYVGDLVGSSLLADELKAEADRLRDQTGDVSKGADNLELDSDSNSAKSDDALDDNSGSSTDSSSEDQLNLESEALDKDSP